MKKKTEDHVFSDGGLDRTTPPRADTQAIEALARDASARFTVLQNGKHLVEKSDQQTRPCFFAFAEVSRHLLDGEYIYLGNRDGAAYFAAEVDANFDPGPVGRLELRPLASLFDHADAALHAYARAMLHWHRGHRFCGYCGQPTRLAAAGHERRCENRQCSTETLFPRVDPAIIVLVTRGDRCLLGRHNKWHGDRFSTIAGFVEPGESIEQAVRREVHEESGVAVGAVHYHSSQPWPFPSSLMIGFNAEGDSETISLNDGELAEARWFTRAELREQILGGQLRISARLSIAYRLVADWYDADPGFSIEELESLVDQH